MSRFELHRFASPAELAQAVAARWLDELRNVAGNARPYCVALAGGRIAGGFFKATAQLARQRGCRLEGVDFFWGDERCVPPKDQESNFKLANDNLFGPLGIAPERIHRIQGEEVPEEAAVAAAKELKAGAADERDGQPVIDLVFLGMGPEGHTASLFPGESPLVMESPAVYRAVTVPKPPPRRVTLGYPALGAARKVWALVSGEGKPKALQESLSAEGRTPLARVLQRREHSSVFTDVLS